MRSNRDCQNYAIKIIVCEDFESVHFGSEKCPGTSRVFLPLGAVSTSGCTLLSPHVSQGSSIRTRDTAEEYGPDGPY